MRVPVASAASPGARPYTQNDGAAGSGPTEGLTPAQLASAYGYEPSAGGTGQTVGIVDAYDDPNIEKDLGEFDKNYGLSECTSESGCLEKVGQSGSTTSLPAPDQSGWSLEISLDVETVHSVCPNCKILLVEADSESDADLAAAVEEAVALGATEVSNSYGGREAEFGEGEQDAYRQPGVPIVAATGDEGYDNWTAFSEVLGEPAMPNAPASLPSVVAVGGTSLQLTAAGARANETVWNDEGPGGESGLGLGATGGGCSTLFSAQPWQQDAPGFAATGCGTARLGADVSAVGDPLTGLAVYDSYECGLYCTEEGVGKGWLTVGGTSLSTQLIAGLYALAGGGQGVEYPALTLYGHLAGDSSLYDVTEGSNGFCDGEPASQCEPEPGLGKVDCQGTTACNAAPGFDGPSGVGTPNGLGLFKPPLPTAVITPPASLTEGTPASFSGEGLSDPYPGGSIAEYSWNWGDESETSSGATPTHTYGEAGTYAVTLTVTDNYGLTSASTTVSISVNPDEAEAAAAIKQEASPPGAGAQGIAGFTSSTQPPVPDAKLASTALAASASGAVSIRVSCPAGDSSCSGTVTLRTLDAVRAGAGRKKTILILARGSFTVAGGRVKAVTLHLSAKARALLARSRTLRVRATIDARDPAGARHTTQTVVTLRAPRAKHGKG